MDSTELPGGQPPGETHSMQVKKHAWQLLSHFQKHQPARPYLLVDPTLRAPEDWEPLGQWLMDRETVPLKISSPSFDKTNTPFLAAFDPDDAQDIDFLWALAAEALQETQPMAQLEGRGRRICAVVFSDSSAHRLATHLGKNTVLRNAQNEQVFLRYFDPAVWPDVWHTLDQTQRARLCGPISTWLALGQDQQWIEYSNPAPETAIPSPPMQLQAAQWSWLDQCANVNAVLHQLHAETGALPTDARHRAREAINRAIHLGYVRPTEVQACALHVLRYGDRFLQHPTVRTLLAKRTAEDSFFSTIASLSDADWMEILLTTSSPEPHEQ